MGLDVSIFPVGETIDLSCFDKINDDFFNWMKDRITNRYSGIDRDTKCLQLWHLRGSDSYPTSNSYLYTFHELLGTTPAERAICGLHNKVIFSSEFSKNSFASDLKTKASTFRYSYNIHSCPLGFDEDVFDLNKTYFDDVVHFTLIGKWESRKNTDLIIKTWAELFGNKKDYRLTCLVDNPFFPSGTIDQLTARCLGGKSYFNISFLPRLKTNSEMNDFYNSTDIDLSGLSSAEGWNLPAFNSTALGKWSCVANHTSHKDWATPLNCVLEEPSGLREPYDQAFFNKGEEFNQGMIYDLTKENIKNAMLASLNVAKTPNLEGLKLKEKFTYEKTVNNLLDICDA